MKIFKKSIYISVFLGLVITFSSYADDTTIYTWVENGVTHYSNEPTNTNHQKSFKIESVTQNHDDNEYMKDSTEMFDSEYDIETAPSPYVKKNVEANINISYPSDGITIQHPGNEIEVDYDASGDFDSANKEIILDGVASNISSDDDESFYFETPGNGQHTLQMMVHLKNGNTISSNTVTFYIQRTRQFQSENNKINQEDYNNRYTNDQAYRRGGASINDLRMSYKRAITGR